MASREISYNGIKYSISYEIVGRGEEILFLHGWGAKKEVMKKAFGSYFDDFRQIYVDLPGFGASSIEKALVTEQYAGIIREFLASIGSHPLCAVGHSFGGKVASLLAPRVLVLLSSAGIPIKKKFSTRVKIRLFKMFKAMGFGFLWRIFASKDVAGMSATMYETLKNVVNEDFTSVFANCPSRILIFWGAEDSTTPLSCGKKISEIARNCVKFEPLSGDHFFFLAHAESIAANTAALIAQMQNGIAQGKSEEEIDKELNMKGEL